MSYLITLLNKTIHREGKMNAPPQCRQKSISYCAIARKSRRWNAHLLSLLCCFWYTRAFSTVTPPRIRGPSVLHIMASVIKDDTTASSTSSQQPRNTSHNNNDKKIARRKIRNMYMKAKNMERHGQWSEACELYNEILRIDSKDAHSHLGLARLEARRNHDNYKARQAFARGARECPNSVHLWQAWALYEQQHNSIDRARELFQKALSLEPNNPYVCHASGLMERKLGNKQRAKELWERALKKKSTAALVCSLGELLISDRKYDEARVLYLNHLLKLESERERSEVYLAAAWLEEKYAHDADRAEELIRLSLHESPGESRAHVALARLEGRRNNGGGSKEASVRRLANACISMEHENATEVTDGRLYNAWAHLEVTSRRFRAARKILLKGIEKFPDDQSVSTIMVTSVHDTD